MRGPAKILKLLFFWLPLLGYVLRAIGGRFRGFLGGTVGKSITYWTALSHFQQNLIIGTVIALAIHFTHDTSYVRDTEDWAMDWLNRLQVDTAALSSEEDWQGDAYVFLDMDEESYQSWEEPYHFPRDKLQNLIEYASSANAKQIVVDVDLSRPGIDSKAADKLKQFLKKYPEMAPQLILMRGLRESSLDKIGLPHFRDAYTGSLIEHNNIIWAQPLFFKDIIDGRIRRWRLIEAVCVEQKPAWYPSPQIVSLSLTSGMDWHAIEKEINAFLPDDGHTPVSKESVNALKLKIGDHAADLGAKGFHQRVIYSYSNKHKLGSAEIGYQRIPAHIITESNTQPSQEPVVNKIVVIGASHQDGRDIHQTPVGSMPGALIVLNAVKSLKQFGQLDSISLWTKILLEALTILLMAYLFQRCNSLIAVFLNGVAIMVLLAPFSFYFFRYGLWVDLAAPILAMQFHFAVEDYIDAIKTRNKLKKLQNQIKVSSG